MDQERQRIQEDLRGRIEGEVFCDDLYMRMYATDASIYEITPRCVVRPRSTGDVVAAVQYAAENELPVHARGSGSGTAGGCLGPGMVIDFSRMMRQVLAVDEQTVRAQAGVVLDQLNRHLRRLGRHFGSGPTPPSVTTVGSIVSVNRKGSRWLRYGATRQRVRSLQIVTAAGDVLEVGQHAFPPRMLVENAGGESQDSVTQIVSQLGQLITDERSALEATRRNTHVDSTGYAISDALQDGQLDLAKLIVGSEGTLALVTEATLETDPLPASVGVALLMFDRLEKAARAALEIRKLSVTACDLLDRRLVSLARESDAHYNVVLPPSVEALLLVEVEGATITEVSDRLRQITHLIQRRRKLAFDTRTALDPLDVALYWGLSGQVLQTLYRLEGTQRPLPFVDDIAVLPERMPQFLIELQNVLKRHQVTASLFAHAGQGQLHIRPFLDLGNPDDVRRMEAVAVDLYAEVDKVGGTVSGEHGDGLSRSWYLRERSDALHQICCQAKRIFDPQGIFNPQKVAALRPQKLTENLRAVVSEQRPAGGRFLVTAAQAAADRVEDSANDARRVSQAGDEGLRADGNGEWEDQDGSGKADAGNVALPARVSSGETKTRELQLLWQDQDIDYAARLCNGCGSCRTQVHAIRMCPIFRLSPSEEASPRAKANIVRGLLSGTLDATELDRSELKTVADLCVNCHQCRLECPAAVDIPKLVLETRAQYVANNGLSVPDALLSRLDTIVMQTSRLRRFANWALRSRRMRWLLEKVAGIAQGRKLPQIAAKPFVQLAHRRQLTRATTGGGRKVLYFVDTYANRFDVELADAMVAVFEHNGVEVYVPPDQQSSGMTALIAGAVNQAREIAAKNVAMLADAIRQGYHIVATEPAAALCLTHEYLHLLDDDDARLVAENTSEACAYLWRMHQQGQLELDLKPVNITLGYHQPCMIRALNVGSPGENLLRLIPGLTVKAIQEGCSGMAGIYGLKRESYRNSLRAGWSLISAMREPTLQVGATECCSCKMQMEQGTTKPTVHPLKLLALAYELRPELADVLMRRSGDLVIT
jgi:FAD/FMN-containing dehydrogenase/Fe-S oxidoreductase